MIYILYHQILTYLWAELYIHVCIHTYIPALTHVQSEYNIPPSIHSHLASSCTESSDPTCTLKHSCTFNRSIYFLFGQFIDLLLIL